jgi:repressor LexA
MRKIDKAYEFIKKYITEKEYPPTIREICDAIDVSSTSTVSYYLRKLEEDNKIIKGSYKNRAIQLMDEATQFNGEFDKIVMPYICQLTEDKPLMAEQNIRNKYIISGSMFQGINMFLMAVLDNAMKNSGILKGDMVVVSRQNAGKNGELVVAVVHNTYVIGRLYKEDHLFKLEFDNNAIQPIYLEKLTILGKVVGVIRNHIEDVN